MKCQARMKPRSTLRWPFISIPLPPGPAIAASVDYCGPLPVTPQRNTSTLLFTDRFSRRADMFTVTAADFTTEGTANVLINRYFLLWGRPRSILSDHSF